MISQFHRGEEWGEFLHLPGQKFFDFNEIRDEIVRETDRVTGRNKGISNKTINLKIFSPFVLNLTLVDLPGITKVPTGDQPEDVEEQIRNMCYEFISNPNAIILAVTAANQDLANSDGLKMARSVDPEGERTVGVLTKVDIMDHGTDCCDILNNKVIPLRRGYIAVMNRSQKDIQENLPIRKGLAKESAFFQQHPKYRQVLSKCSTRNLARTLNQMLMTHIRDCLPEIKARVNKLLLSVQGNLDSLGDSIDDQSSSEKGAILLRILSSFANNFTNKIDGKGSNEFYSEMTELYGGARISYIFNEIFGKKLKTLDPFEGLEDDDIRTAISNANGTRPSLFVPEISFDLLVRRQIARLEQPGLQCLDMVLEEMQKMVAQSETLDLQRFPDLRDRTMEVVLGLLKNCMSPATKMISNLIQIELAYINTSHPDFIGGKAAVAAAAAAQQNRVKTNTTNNPALPPGNTSGTAVSPVMGSTGGNGGGNDNSYSNSNNLPNPPNFPAGNSSSMVNNGATNNSNFRGFFQPGNNNNNNSSLPTAGGAASGRYGAANPPSTMNPSNGPYRNQPASAGPTSSYDDYNNIIRLPPVPEKMRCNSTPSDRERYCK
jgi:dynamin 1-like protein